MTNFKLPSNFNPPASAGGGGGAPRFQEIANGFFQAEGHISCRIKNLSFRGGGGAPPPVFF